MYKVGTYIAQYASSTKTKIDESAAALASQENLKFVLVHYDLTHTVGTEQLVAHYLRFEEVTQH